MNKTTKNIIVLLFLSSALGITYNFINPNGISVIHSEEQIKMISDETLENSSTNAKLELKGISLQQSLKLFKIGVSFIDARDNWDFADGHIKGAINIPEFSFEPNDSLANELDKTFRYVIYCSSNDCDISKRLAKELMKLGFEDILVFNDGYEVWRDNNYPIEVNK